jgi:hypothetical protein
MIDTPKIGIECMTHNACETCASKPAKYIIKNKFTDKKLRICDDCKAVIIGNN